MEPTSRIERWAWLGFFLLALALLTPPGMVLGLALWFWARWKKGARIRWLVVGVLVVAGWVGLSLLLDTVGSQIILLRVALLMFSDVGLVLQRLWPLWVEGLLLAPTFACLIELFHPATTLKLFPASTAQPKQPQLPPGTRPGKELLPAPAPEAAPPVPEEDFGEPPAQASA